MKTVIIIPARYGSSRYEGKPLIKINKVPLIIRVARKCIKVLGKQSVFVATDDKRISNVVEEYKIELNENGFHNIPTEIL